MGRQALKAGPCPHVKVTWRRQVPQNCHSPFFLPLVLLLGVMPHGLEHACGQLGSAVPLCPLPGSGAAHCGAGWEGEEAPRLSEHSPGAGETRPVSAVPSTKPKHSTRRAAVKNVNSFSPKPVQTRNSVTCFLPPSILVSDMEYWLVLSPKAEQKCAVTQVGESCRSQSAAAVKGNSSQEHRTLTKSPSSSKEEKQRNQKPNQTEAWPIKTLKKITPKKPNQQPHPPKLQHTQSLDVESILFCGCVKFFCMFSRNLSLLFPWPHS